MRCLWHVCLGSRRKVSLYPGSQRLPDDIQVCTVLPGAQLPGPSVLVSGELGTGTVGEVATRLRGSAGLGLAGRALWGCSRGARGHAFGRWIPVSLGQPPALQGRLSRHATQAPPATSLCTHLRLGSGWGLGSWGLCQGGPGSCQETRAARESCSLWGHELQQPGCLLVCPGPWGLSGHLRAPHQSLSVSPVPAPSFPTGRLDVPLVWDMWGTVSGHPKPPPGPPLTGLAYKL